MELVLLMSARRQPALLPANASISDASSARSESQGSIKGSIPIARWRSCKFAGNKKRRFAALLQSPLTDSNRRPPGGAGSPRKENDSR
jgi:hypothetical protein